MEKKVAAILPLLNPVEPEPTLLSSLTPLTERSVALAGYSIFAPTAARERKIRAVVCAFATSEYAKFPAVDRAIGSLMAQAMGDSIGSQSEGIPVDYSRKMFEDFDEKYFTKRGMAAGNITDDTGMAQCLADSLIKKQGLDCRDFLIRCLMWWYMGYDNYTGLTSAPAKVSHGMGGTSRGSLTEFLLSGFTKTVSTFKGKPSNGSIMRLAPLPLYYHDNLQLAITKAAEQSHATHPSLEAADAARVLAYVIVKAVNYPGKWTGQKDFGKAFLDSLDFAEVRSTLETEEAKLLIQREGKWDWKKPDFQFPLNCGGFMANDGLAMALHCTYAYSSPTEAILKAANIGGDADTVAAISGQIIGALYGISAFPEKWNNYILRWDREGEIALKGILLALKKTLD